MDKNVYKSLIAKLLEELKVLYGDRLVSVAIFGSFARNDMRPDSDLDILIIARDLPNGRMRRVAEFLEVENRLSEEKARLALQKIYPYLSPIFKTPEEAGQGSPLFLDMTEEIEMYYDWDDFFKNILDAFRERLRALGSQRIWEGKMWYWVLKPDLKPGEVIEI